MKKLATRILSLAVALGVGLGTLGTVAGMGPQRARGVAPEGALTHGRGDRPMIGRRATNGNEGPSSGP